MSEDAISRLLLEPLFASALGTRSLRPLSHRKFAQIIAAYEAGEIYTKYLYNRPCFGSFLDHLVAAAKIAAASGEGMFLEFGVASGKTIRAIAGVASAVTGFDSFAGLPQSWRDGVGKGAFAAGVPAVPANVRLEIGMIADTLPKFLANHPGEIRFIHIDTDLYEPAKFILDCCGPRMSDAVIVFDEFFNYVGWRDHEYKAWREFQVEHSGKFEFDYLGCTEEAAVSVRVKRRA